MRVGTKKKSRLGFEVLLIAIGLGLMWHGIQIVWVAPTASQFKKDLPPVVPGTDAAFNRFWLDQYAWIGIGLTMIGLVLLVAGVVT